MAPKPGIFDPWRQEEAPPLNERPARKALPMQSVYEDEGEQCVQFNGLVGGVNVWLPESAADVSATAREVLVDLVHRLCTRGEVVVLFATWGISTTAVFGNTTDLVIGHGPKKLYIRPGDVDIKAVPRAIDKLAMALRECAQEFGGVQDLLSAVKVSPYVK